LLIHYFHHLRGTPWAAQVITRRAPRGPNYLRLSERLCVLLEEQGAADPLGAAYALSNFVIGSAATSSIDEDELSAPVDPQFAPRYAQLHAGHVARSEEIVVLGISALRSALTDRARTADGHSASCSACRRAADAVSDRPRARCVFRVRSGPGGSHRGPAVGRYPRQGVLRARTGRSPERPRRLDPPVPGAQPGPPSRPRALAAMGPVEDPRGLAA